MLADVYPSVTVRNAAGQLKTIIDRDNPVIIRCFARYLPIEGFSASSRVEFGDLVFDKGYVHLRTRERIFDGKDSRIGNIRHVDRYGRETSGFLDDNGNPLEFVVDGEISKHEPWSQIIEWVYVLELPAS